MKEYPGTKVLEENGYNPNQTVDENREANIFNPREALRRILPHPNPFVLRSKWENVTSLLITRHPMDRLLSLYNNKFLEKVKNNNLWANIADFIISKYREGEEKEDAFVTPDEMIR